MPPFCDSGQFEDEKRPRSGMVTHFSSAWLKKKGPWALDLNGPWGHGTGAEQNEIIPFFFLV